MGDLPEKYYRGLSAPTTQTSYKWAFTNDMPSNSMKGSSVLDSGEGPTSKRFSIRTSGRIVGPVLPSESDRQLAKEREAELAVLTRQSERRRDRQEQRGRIEDQVGPKESGREGMLEKKRAQRESNNAARDAKDDAGLEVNDTDLMGEGDSFRAMSVTNFLSLPCILRVLQDCKTRCKPEEVRRTEATRTRSQNVRNYRETIDNEGKGENNHGHVQSDGQREIWVD
jgi:hypothetical protein